MEWLASQRMTSKTATDLLELVNTTEKMQAVSDVVTHYVRIFRPVADYIDMIANDHVGAWLVVQEEGRVLGELESQLVALSRVDEKSEMHKLQMTWLQTLITEFRASTMRGDNLDFFKSISFLSPVHGWNLKEVVTREFFIETTSMSSEHVPNDEWESYITMADQELISPVEESRPSMWWEKRKHRFPKLYPVATFLLSLPCVVTNCDSLLSLEAILFSSRQARKDPDHAGKVLMCAALGKQLKRCGDQ